MSRWTVHRLWRNVEAGDVNEAIQKSKELQHDEVRAGAQHPYPDGMAQLYYTRDELRVLQMSVGLALVTTEENLALVQSDETRALMQSHWTTLNALRTSLAEARYGLMTQAEIFAEHAAQAEARAAGIID